MLLSLFSSHDYKINAMPSMRMCASSISDFYFFVYNNPMKLTEQVYNELMTGFVFFHHASYNAQQVKHVFPDHLPGPTRKIQEIALVLQELTV